MGNSKLTKAAIKTLTLRIASYETVLAATKDAAGRRCIEQQIALARQTLTRGHF